MFPRSLIALSTACVLAACSSDFRFEEIELQVRCGPPGSTAGILLVEKGLHGESGEGTATDALRSILQGRRRFPPDGGFLSMDFDELERKFHPGSEKKPDEFDRDVRDLAHGFRVEKTGLFEDEKGRLCLYQFWTVEDPAGLVRWFDDQTNKDLLQRVESGRQTRSDFPYLDDRSRSRALERARAGGSWIRLEERGIVFDLPITRECAAKCAADLVDKEQTRKDFGPFVSKASSIEIGDERTLLRYLPGPSGWLGPWSTVLEQGGDGRLQAWIKAGALPIGAPPDLRELERILGLRESLKNEPK